MNPKIEALSLLQASRLLLEDKKNWTQGTMAKDKIGNHVLPNTTRATCWCSVGALEVLGGHNNRAYVQALLELNDAAPLASAVATNDLRTHKTVLKMFDKAIANLAKEIDTCPSSSKAA